MDKLESLKEYEHPPVGEVELGIQFRRLPQLSSNIGMARFVDHITSNQAYIVNEQPEFPPRFETEQSGGSGTQIAFSSGTPGVCVSFLNAECDQLLRVQADRLWVRWLRKQNSDYKRYANILEDFKSAYSLLESWLNNAGGAQISIEQSEIQYVNFVEYDEDPTRYFNFIDLSRFQGSEGLQFATSQRLTDRSEIGRLYLEAQTQEMIIADENNLPQQKKVLKVFLTFRGRPTHPGLDGALLHFGRGHHAIVKTFTSILSDVAKEKWGERSRKNEAS